MFDDLKLSAKYVRLPKKGIDYELRPFCRLCLSFSSITLVSTQEKRAQILVEKWNKKRRKKEQKIE